MEITEVRISRRTQGDAKLKGYAAVTFDDVFVVRDLKIIEGKKGLFVAMPSQKIYEPCTACGKKNAIHSKFCNECGKKLEMDQKDRRESHRDIAHPVNSDMRTYLQKVIIEAYNHNGPEAAEEPEDSLPGDVNNNRKKTADVREPVAAVAALAADDYLSTPTLDDKDRVTREDDLSRELLDTID